MASTVLRSLRFLRNWHHGSRLTVSYSKRGRKLHALLNHSHQAVSRHDAKAIRFLATVQQDASVSATTQVADHKAPSSVQGRMESLDKLLYKLDLVVRRIGRISRTEVEDIFSEIQAIGTATTIQSLLLIRCCGSLIAEDLPAERNELTLRIWNKLQELNCPMDISHYNALLQAFLDNEHKFQPTDILSEIEKKGLQPNRVTYQRLITRYCQEGDMNGASTILEYMKSQSIPIDESVFNPLIIGYLRANDVENAKNILQVMRNAHLQPTADTYTALLCGFAEKGDIAAMNEALQEADKHEIHFLDKDYLQIILTLAVNGHAGHVDMFLERICKLAGYNQDCITTILMLVNHGQDDVAYKLLKTMPRGTQADGSATPSGMFFINQLVRRDRPVEKVLEFCEDLKQNGLNENAIVGATKVALMFKKIDMAFMLIEEMYKQGHPIRAHYFWPILAVYRDQNRENEIYETLKVMASYNCLSTYETFTDYALPGLNMDDPETVIQKLKDIGVPVGVIVNLMVNYYLIKKKPKFALSLVEKYPVQLNGNLLIRALAIAYKNTQDAASVVQIVKHIAENRERGSEQYVDIDWGGRLLLAYLFVDRNNPQAFEKLLSEMHKEKVYISHSSVDSIHRNLKGRVSQSATSVLESLGTNTLQERDDQSGIPHPKVSVSHSSMVRIHRNLKGNVSQSATSVLESLETSTLQERDNQSGVPHHEMNIDELENHLDELKSKGLNTMDVLRKLLVAHCRNKNLERVEEIKSELEAEGFTFSSSMHAQLIDLYTSLEKLSEALKHKTAIEEQDPSFVLDDYKVLNLASLCVKDKNFDEAVKLIEQHVLRFPNRRHPSAVQRNVFRLLKTAAGTGDIAWTDQLYDLTVTKHKFTEPSNSVLGPLIQVRLMNDKFDEALAVFERLVEEHRCTPWKMEFTKRLLTLQETEKLQKVTKLSIEVHGEMDAMVDLAICCIETGYAQEARKIFETPGLRVCQPKFDYICERFVDQDKIKELETLISITRDLFDVNRDNMFYHLIRVYAKHGEVQKALSVWTQMQEEDVQPSARTLNFLGNFLKRNNETVPFIIPSVPEEILSPSSKALLSESIRKGEMDKAIELKQQIESEGEQLGVKLTSKLINGLLEKDRLKEAVNICQELISYGYYPLSSTLRFLFIKLARAGDIHTMEVIGKGLPNELRQFSTFDNLWVTAYINTGQHMKVLEMLEGNVRENPKNFPLGGILGLLEKHPELEERVASLCKKYKEEMNFVKPLNMLWIHYMQREMYDKADAVFQSTPEMKQELLFSPILKKIRENQNELMARKLVDVVKSTDIASRIKGLAFGALINRLVSNKTLNKAIALLDEAIKQHSLKLEDFNHTCLARLKANALKHGKEFPYELPVKVNATSETSSSESSDSSDDEIEKR